MNRLLVIALFSGLLIGGAGVAEETRPGEGKRFLCRFTQEAVTVDGRADEVAWQAAEVVDSFSLPWLQEQSRPARTATRARLLWDHEHLYFFAEMEDSDLYADVTEHDGDTWLNDVFELFFKPADGQPGYYEFQVNAAGTKLDMFLPRRGAGGLRRFVKDGSFAWQTKVVLAGTLNNWRDDDRGWSVEGRIPWQDFNRTGGRPKVGARWKFALCRYDYSVDFEGPELSTCAPLSSQRRPDFHHHEDYATLEFVKQAPGKVQSETRNLQKAKFQAKALGIIPVCNLHSTLFALHFLAPPQRDILGDVQANWRKVPSRVAGSPEPPLPFRVERTLPKFELSLPMFVTVEPGTRRLVFIEQNRGDQPCRISRTTETPDTGEFETWLELPKGVIAYDIAFHPQYAENGFVYIPCQGIVIDGGEKMCVLKRYTVGRQPPYKLDPQSALDIIEWPSNGHNGSAVTFGQDGMLYVTTGDGTSDSDTNVTGQGMDHLLAKLLRINVDQPDAGRAYSVPEDNPFVGVAGVRPETWAYGFRNPWRITTDPRTGAIWVGNNGQDLWEQVYLVERGANYGWSVYEGSHPFYPNRKLGPTPHVKPTFEHPHSEARSLTGGVVYYGAKFPDLQGAYIYGDYSTGKIWGGKVQNGRVVWHEELADTTLQIAGFAIDADGELLIVDHRGNGEGGFYTFVKNDIPADATLPKFPRKLSETGLFTSVAGHQTHPGLLPYSVNAPLWSDGAHKERFLYLPDSTGIEFPSGRGWTLPDGTVAVKSFALETEAGNPQSRRWIETRLMTRQQGEWVGYSYRWNDEQTEATLVEMAGADTVFDIRDTDGSVRKQPWRYPSRAECMVCHSRAANFVLGLSTLQFNKTHDYGGHAANQLDVLDWLGMLRKKTKSPSEPQVSATGPPTLPGELGPKHPHLVDPSDESADLTARAKSYLHANCAQCHVEAGGGNAQMELGFNTALDKMRLVDVPPIHHRFGIEDARLVVPGDPERSVLLHRMAIRGAGQMPQLATTRVDEEAVELLRRWIAEMPTK